MGHMTGGAFAATALALLLGASAPAQAPVVSAGSAGYLGAAVPDATALVGPPPAPGSLQDQADVAAFEATRRLEGGPRWSLAASDAQITGQNLLDDFSCALGVRLDAGNAPALARLADRVIRDAGATTAAAKARYRRPRPFVGRSGAICVARDDGLAKSFSYPSGHATAGWSLGLILAELAPERAGEVLARARGYGESRVVCGVHYPSDVQAGRTAASALVAVLHAVPAFQTDLAQAREEIARARAGGAAAPAAPRCALERQAAAEG